MRNSSSDQDGPQLWAQLCECLQAVGDTNGAIAMYRDVIGGAHTAPLPTQLPTAQQCQLQDTASCTAQGPFGTAANTLCKCRPSFPKSRQGATGCNPGQIKPARWDAPLSIWKGAPWSSWSTGCTNGLLKLGRLAAGLEEGTGEFMEASLPFLHRSRQGATGCKQAILKLGRLAAGLEEGTGEFMEASLALADLLFRVGHADAATQLLLGGDTVRLLQGCYVHITLPCQRHGLNGN